MKENALSVANYFVKLAKKDHKELRLLGLLKRVYIAHGFYLAIYHEPLIDKRFDKVEAWKYGPVIPSVYHSFKQYRNNAITEETDILEWDDKRNEPFFSTPELTEDRAKKIVTMVWKRYSDFSDSEMVSLTHRKGTPWSVCYIPERNMPIPDEITALYYEKLVATVIKNNER